jgi:hypothetical protein
VVLSHGGEVGVGGCDAATAGCRWWRPRWMPEVSGVCPPSRRSESRRLRNQAGARSGPTRPACAEPTKAAAPGGGLVGLPKGLTSGGTADTRTHHQAGGIRRSPAILLLKIPRRRQALHPDATPARRDHLGPLRFRPHRIARATNPGDSLALQPARARRPGPRRRRRLGGSSTVLTKSISLHSACPAGVFVFGHGAKQVAEHDALLRRRVRPVRAALKTYRNFSQLRRLPC